MSNPSLELRLDRLESRVQLRELMTTYCIAADDRDLTSLGKLFTDDVSIGSKDGRMQARGREQALSMFNTLFQIRGPSCHWTHDTIVNFDACDLDRATGLVIAHAETTPNGQACVAAIRYSDEYRRESGVWLFASRLIQFLYYLPVAEYKDRLPTPLRIGIYGAWCEADFPETLDSWQRWFSQGSGLPGNTHSAADLLRGSVTP